MAYSDIKQIVLFSTFIFLLAPVFIIIYIGVYNRRKKKHIEEKAQMKVTFNAELLKTQIEIQEETLNHISQEIHDNITQVLSFVKLNLALTDNLDEQAKQAKIKESRDLIAQTIYDLRDLSKSLSFEHIAAIGLVKTIEIEAERINKSGIIEIGLSIKGEAYRLGEQRELVLFRIFQEALNNTLKHSGASQLKINLQYHTELFNLTLEDDGAGFSPGTLTNGSGLRNMQSRAALIGAVLTINSLPGKGCVINVTLNPLEKQLYADGNIPNSAG